MVRYRQCFVWKQSSLSKYVGSLNEYAELMHEYAVLEWIEVIL